jgi:hypothetical protein
MNRLRTRLCLAALVCLAGRQIQPPACLVRC